MNAQLLIGDFLCPHCSMIKIKDDLMERRDERMRKEEEEKNERGRKVMKVVVELFYSINPGYFINGLSNAKSKMTKAHHTNKIK